jgi:hypothetical protein
LRTEVRENQLKRFKSGRYLRHTQAYIYVMV